MLIEKQEENSSPRKKKGQTLVEVTLILPLVVLLVGAAVDWGLLLFVSHVAQNAVREGARVAVTKTSMTEASSAAAAEINSRIPETPLFADFRGSVDVSCTATGIPRFITVATSGNFNFMFTRLIGFTNTTISRSASMRYERFDDRCPSPT
jgi:Flp pilus assembly protein TadG